jgi:hypothetical protein
LDRAIYKIALSFIINRAIHKIALSTKLNGVIRGIALDQVKYRAILWIALYFKLAEKSLQNS